MKVISVVPRWPQYYGNRLFEDPNTSLCIVPYAQWKTAARAAGFSMDTCDVVPVKDADIIWFLDLPATKAEFDEIRSQARPGVKLVLQIFESPLYAAHSMEPRNQAPLDAVITFERSRGTSNNRVHQYYLPNSLAPYQAGEPPIPFGQRRLSVMLNTNKVRGWKARFKKGLIGLPGIGECFSGWKYPLWKYFQPARGELLSWRRRLARVAETFPSGTLDIYGRLWYGERVNWWLFPRPRPYRCRLEAPDLVEDLGDYSRKFELFRRYRFVICAENALGDDGYISEKILDIFRSGSVPVYLGDASITNYIPAAAIVDVRNFANQRALLQYLQDCPEPEWQKMCEAGAQFLASPQAQVFSPEAFVKLAMGVLHQICPSP